MDRRFFTGVSILKLTFPPIGARIVKSSIAVGLCMAVYFIRTFLPVENGIPFYGALAALWCIQPYTDTTKNNALQRSVGTLTGAAYGLLFLLLFRRLGLVIPELVYISASIVIIPVIYTTVVMNKRNASFFSCVVFLSIALTHSFDETPYLFVLNRVVDTFIGIIISLSDSEYEGFMYLKVFSPLASKENMMTRLKECAGAEKVVTFGSIRDKYDVYINDGGGNATVKRLKKICRAHGHL